MTKNDRIINLVFKSTGLKLDKSQLNSSTINKTGIYSVEPNVNRKDNEWSLVLINTKIKKLYVFCIPANDIIYNKLYFRDKKNVYRLLFNVADENFIELQKSIRFDKFLVGECTYQENLF